MSLPTSLIEGSRLRPARHASRTTSPAALVERLESRTFFSATPAATAEQLVAQANNAFAFDLLHKLSPDSSGNTFFSPYSVATAVEMALQGAKGVTASEIIQTLHLPSDELAQAGIQALYQLFQAAPANAGYTLSTANRLWVDDNFPLLASFLSSSNTVFGAGPQSVDFSNPSAAANTINSWVSDQTDGKITNLISPGALNAYTGLVITNAIYFQGNWASAFDPNSTLQKSFQISSTEASTVSMMQQINNFGYYAQSGANGFQALDLPYVGNNLDMLVILPTTYDLNSFQSTLTPDVFSQIASSLITTDVDVSLPKFQLNETYDLVKPLESLGIQTAFSPSADFSGISSDPLLISDVVQKSFVNVDETGTTAAAATAVIMATCAVVMPSAAPVSFDAHHPFLFAIRDNATNTILFLGAMNDPSNGSADITTPATPLSDPIVPTATGQTPTQTAPVISPASLNAAATTLATVDLPAIPSGATRSVTIHWGDGTHSIGALTPDGAVVDITGSHHYRSNRKFHVVIDVSQKSHGKTKILSRVKLVETEAALEG